MKKAGTILLVITLIFILTSSVFATNSPAVVKNHGVISGYLISTGNNEISLNGEFGITDKLAIIGSLGDHPMSRLGVKYEVKPVLAMTGGFFLNKQTPFFGINGATPLTNKLLGTAELDITMPNGNLSFVYDMGLIYDLPDNMSIRGGITGDTANDYSPYFKLGLGYGF